MKKNNHAMKICTIAAGILCLVMPLIGCETVPEREDVAPGIYIDDNITIVANYVSKTELKEEYGVPNPYVAPNLLISRFELVTFDLVITAKSGNIVVEGNNIGFVFEGRQGVRQHTSQLENLWTRFTGTGLSDSDIDDGVRIIEQYAFPSIVHLTMPDDARKGYIVYRGQFPVEGNGAIVVPYRIGDEEYKGEIFISF